MQFVWDNPFIQGPLWPLSSAGNISLRVVLIWTRDGHLNLWKNENSQVNCKICLKSTGLNEFFGWFCVVLFEGSSPLKKCLNFDGLSRLDHHQTLRHFFNVEEPSNYTTPIKNLIQTRSHFRNRPNGGHYSPQRYTLTRFADHFSSYYSQRVQSLFKELNLLYFV